MLATLFSHLAREDQIESFLYAFQDLRQGRCARNRVTDMANIHFMTMPEGERTRMRDFSMRTKFDRGEDVLGGTDDGNVSKWDDIWDLFGYDAEDEADNWWIQWGLLREHANPLVAEGVGVDSGLTFSLMNVHILQTIC